MSMLLMFGKRTLQWAAQIPGAVCRCRLVLGAAGHVADFA
jgi:hypothetical protein